MITAWKQSNQFKHYLVVKDSAKTNPYPDLAPGIGSIYINVSHLSREGRDEAHSILCNAFKEVEKLNNEG